MSVYSRLLRAVINALDQPAPAAGAGHPTHRVARGALTLVFAITVFGRPALAHGGPGIQSQPVDTPIWLFLLTGGGVIAVSFLLTSFVTDRGVLDAYHERRLSVPGGAVIRDWGTYIAAILGVAGLAAVLVIGVFGPPDPGRNLAVLLVWAVWWAGFTISTYLIGNAWPAIDPFARLTDLLPERGGVDLPAWVGRWPAVAGLLLLVWLEVVSNVASDPIQLATVVGLYAVASLVGSAILGSKTWRRQIDPISNVFRLYGKIAPVQRSEDGLVLAAPGAGLANLDDPDEPTAGTTLQSEVGFVIALLWVTSYDGFVATPGWEALAGPVVRAGLPAELTYFGALLLGYGLFLAAYWWASKLVRRAGRTFRSRVAIGAAFAPSLVPIAAGYHLGHYLPYFLRLAPSSAVVAASPLSPPLGPPVLVLPGWVASIGPIAVLAGHVLAVWVAHSRAFELFTGKLQPIRSQYPYVLVMVLYTMTGLWLLAQPTIDAPFL
ncbi:MAG: hypothetical protein V5A38_11935 [Halolamina sp.]|uniref:hypothetical protein n=1 Tax=Halolamina sp. TaxID=1940283 RepID=UPI002FC38FD8